MTINATLPPTVDEFRKAFPEFADVTDDQVQFYLDQGMLWVDTFWEPIDAKLAAMYCAAHYLMVHDFGSGGVITDPADAGTGIGSSDPDVGKIWVKTVRFRDRMVTFDRVASQPPPSAGGGGAGAPSDDFWESTEYGQIYLSYRRRNVPHVAVV